MKQAERSEATRAALVAAARPLFAARGFSGVGTEEIVRAAGVTRGALYHQFRDKEDLFAAVFEVLESELAQRTAAAAGASGTTDPLVELRVGAEAWLDACTEPEIQRIVLLDGPAVLGWERWREIDAQHFGGKIPRAIAAAMDAGLIARQPVEPLARLLLGAVTEAAVACAGRTDVLKAGNEYTRAFKSLLEALRV